MRKFKNNGGGDLRGRPSLVGRDMILSDIADALFFRAVDRDRRHARPPRLSVYNPEE